MKEYFKIETSDLTDELPNQVVPIFSNIDEYDSLVEFNAESLPILPLRNMVMFHLVPLPVSIGRSKSMKLIKEAEAKKLPIGVFCQVDPNNNEPEFADLHNVGVVAEILKILEMPDQTTTVILQGKSRIKLESVISTKPYLKGRVSNMEEIMPMTKDKEFKALVSSIKDLMFQILNTAGGGGISQEILFSLRNITDPFYLINFICAQLPIDALEKQKLLNIDDVKKRCFNLIKILSREAQLLEMKATIHNKTREEMDQQQKEYFLQQQIRTIQEELGGTGNEIEINEIRIKASTRKWGKEVKEIFEKELKKLERLHPQSPEYSTQSNYLQLFIDLPWNDYTNDSYDLKKAQRVLDKDHYGLNKVKERIIEHLAVLKLKGDMKSPILCLVGPPGVGKTSLGKSIAESLKRKYIRVSFGGLHDESEIRGHRKTYIGAMPGRIIKGLQKAGSSNPVFVLDEIDKIGSNFKGDPAAALLEVLDPEQNSTFHDNFLDVDFDLSKVLFIATANSTGTISQPLLDRMELINVSGYILEEKIEIAKKHLIPKQIENHGLDKTDIKLSKQAIAYLIDNYTRESGVRELDKQIARLMRKIAKQKVDKVFLNAITSCEEIEKLLGKPKFMREKLQDGIYPGVVTGLAWTAVGGDILFIESSMSKGSGKLSITGNLGEVMKESAILALEYIKSHTEELGISDDVFEKNNFHIHVPEGAIPKDGPSAGITMATSLVSTILKKRVKNKLAMTGEITLRGAVLPVGGIKEKILAAKRAGVEHIILCEENRKDIEEIEQIYLDNLKFIFVKEIKEVLSYAINS